jgi:hypothetical protein
MATTFIKTVLIIYFHFHKISSPPLCLFIFLALLAAEQCVAVKLADDLLSRASQRRQILLPGFWPAQTAGTEIGCL